MKPGGKSMILVLHDGEAHARMLLAALANTGRFETIDTDDVDEALTLALSAHPHAVLAALARPGMSNIELTMAVRDRNASIPILVALTKGDEGAIPAIIAAGATVVIPRAADPHEIIARLDEVLSQPDEEAFSEHGA